MRNIEKTFCFYINNICNILNLYHSSLMSFTIHILFFVFFHCFLFPFSLLFLFFFMADWISFIRPVLPLHTFLPSLNILTFFLPSTSFTSGLLSAILYVHYFDRDSNIISVRNLSRFYLLGFFPCCKKYVHSRGSLQNSFGMSPGALGLLEGSRTALGHLFQHVSRCTYVFPVHFHRSRGLRFLKIKIEDATEKFKTIRRSFNYYSLSNHETFSRLEQVRQSLSKMGTVHSGNLRQMGWNQF